MSSRYLCIGLEDGAVFMSSTPISNSEQNSKTLFIPVGVSESNPYKQSDLEDLHQKIQKPFLNEISKLVASSFNAPCPLEKEAFEKDIREYFDGIRSQIIAVIDALEKRLGQFIFRSAQNQFMTSRNKMIQIFQEKYNFKEYFGGIQENGFFENLSMIFHDLFSRSTKSDDEEIQLLYKDIQKYQESPPFSLNKSVISTLFDSFTKELEAKSSKEFLTNVRHFEVRNVLIKDPIWKNEVFPQKLSDFITFEQGFDLKSASLHPAFLTFPISDTSAYPYENSFAVVSLSAFYTSVYSVSEPCTLKLKHSFSHYLFDSNATRCFSFVYMEKNEKPVSNIVPPGKGAFVFGHNRGSLSIWDPNEGRLLLEIKRAHGELNSVVRSVVCYKKKGEVFLLSFDSNGHIRVWDFITMTVLVNWHKVHQQPLTLLPLRDTTETCSEFAVIGGFSVDDLVGVSVYSIDFRRLKITKKRVLNIMTHKVSAAALISKEELALLLESGWNIVNLKTGKKYLKGKCRDMLIGGTAVSMGNTMECGRIPNLVFWVQPKEKTVKMGHGWSSSEKIKPISDAAAAGVHHPSQGCIHLFLTANGWKSVGVIPYMPERGTSRELKFTLIT